MKQSIVYILIAIAALTGACKKTEYPKETRVDGNYFYSDLSVNGSSLRLKAGQDGYYMYSSCDTTRGDSSRISIYTGEFKKANCETCTNSIRIRINDRQPIGQNSGDVNQAIKPNMYSFFSGVSNLRYQVNFTGLYNKTASQILWDFGDGNFSSELNPTHSYLAGTYKVTLRISSLNGCQSVMEQTLSPGPNTMNATVSNTVTARVITVTPTVYGGIAPYTYYWNFGDGSPEVATTSLKSTHAYSLRGAYPVKLKVKDSEGSICYTNLNAITKDDSSACAANFSYSKPSETIGSNGSTNVSIQFTDASGITYNSDSAVQPETSSLEILSVEEFERNEKGEPVKRVRLKFDCAVYNGNRRINLKGTEVYIGFAYK